MRGRSSVGIAVLLASSSVAALLAGGGSAFALCAISPGTNQPSVSNSAKINCININGITVTGNVTNTITGVTTPIGVAPPSQTGITINNSTVGGAVINSGEIRDDTGGIKGIFVTNNADVAGGVNNSGTISAGSAGIFVGGTPVTNGASVTISTFAGGISNSGTISGNFAGVFVGGIGSAGSVTISTFTGGISNSGTISVGGDGIMVGGVDISVGSSKTMSVAVSTFTGGISNSGTISGSGGYGILVGGDAGVTGRADAADITISIFAGGISNSGTISAATGNGILVGGYAYLGGAGADTADVTISTFAGGISNSGTISVDGNGILVGGYATIGGAGDTAFVTISTFAGGISNSGIISVGGVGISVGSDGPSALVTISTFAAGISNSGLISAGGDGILVGGNADVIGFVSISTFAGGISNSGTILVGGEGIFIGENVSITSGSINGSYVTISTFAGGISNSGTISAGGDGIFIGGNASFSGGRIDTLNVTISTFGGSTFGSGISNSGTILAGGDGILIGGNASTPGMSKDAFITVSTFAGGIGNSGIISAGGNGIFIGGNASGTAHITIETFAGGISNSGTISAGGDGIFLGGAATGIHASVTISTFSGGITNSGTIKAQTGIAVGSVVQTFLGAIVNSGTISGSGGTAIDVSEANNAITIDQTGGLISGTIKLSAYADVLNISGGTIAGNIIGAGSSDTINFNLGSGSFTYGAAYGFTAINQVNINSGTVVLAGTNNATNVDVLGGTLAGTGTLDPLIVTIHSGGTLAPGTPGGFGTLTIDGNLAFNAGSYYAIQIAPGAGNNSATLLNGIATLGGNGTVVVTPLQLGHYDADYVILSSTTRAGTFAGLTVNGDFSGSIALDYSIANEVLLDANGFDLLATPSGANQNQQNVVGGINNGIFNLPANTTLPPQFANLGNLSGPALLNALTQLSGEVGTGAEQSAFQLTTEFLDLMLDPFVNGRGNLGSGPGGGGPALGFAPDQQANLPPDIALAYDEVFKAPPKTNFDQRWSAWGAGFGGSGTSNGDPSVGSNNVT
ncbi:MAG: hypothetical protein WB868_12410, partial [Xanthobacteraceae bacterium]